MRACTKSHNRGVGAVSSSRYLIMAGGFPFSSVPRYTTSAATSLRYVGICPDSLASTFNRSLEGNCKAGFEVFTDGSKYSALRYLENDSSGAEVRRYGEPLSSSAAGDQLAISSNNSCTTDTLQAAFKAGNCTGPCICCQGRKPGMDASKKARANAALHTLNSQRICPNYCFEFEIRKPTQEISLEFKPGSINDAYSHNMLSKSSEDSEAVRAVEAEIYSKGLAAFSESISESGLQENYVSCRQNHDVNKGQQIIKDSKRKVREMEKKVVAVEIQSGRNVELETRVVRVSRLTGGKDRHSKVRTAKGLRDRRVRLSVCTAIEFYDLQDRLGLEQPSKAVDWLISAAKSAIDELPALEMPSASAGNMAQLNSSNSSHLMQCVGSPRQSATAAVASTLKAFGFGQGTKSRKAINGKAISITALKESDLGRSNSGTSDGSVKGSVEYTSNCSMSKPDSKNDARLKGRQRARKKSASAKNSVASISAIQQLNSIHPSLRSLSKNGFPYTTLPLEHLTFSKDDNLCGIQTQVLTGIGNVQQQWDYNAPSYTEILCTQDSHTLQNMASSSTTSLQDSFPSVPNTSSLPAVIGSSCLHSYEMADSAIPMFEPNQNRHFGSNAAQDQANLFYSNIPMYMKKVEQQQQQQQTQTDLKYFASMAVPTFSNDINFSTSSVSSRGPLQSNSSSITSMPSISETRKNAYDEEYLKTAHFVPFQGYNSQIVFPAIHNGGQRKA